jgi:type II secretory pathway pseudopilin PulG
MDMVNELMLLEKYEDHGRGLVVKLGKSIHPCKAYHYDERGSVLVGLIIVMVIFAILSLSLLPMFSTSSLHQVRADQALRAHYLAESGYRYAASKFLHGGTGEDRDEVLPVLHDNEYIFNGNKSAFDLEIEAYFYKYKGMDGATLKAEVFGEVPETIPTNGSGVSGTLAVFNDPTLYHDYNGYSIETGTDGPEIHFTITGGTSPAGTRVFPALKPNSSGTQSLSTGNDLSFEGDGLLLPPRFGAFRVYDASGNEKYSKIYTYDEVDLDTNKLIGITELLDPDSAFTITVDTDDYIVLQRFIRFTSTGKFGDLNGSYATKTLAYSVPMEAIKTLGFGDGTEEIAGDDLLHDLADNAGPGASLGQFEVQNVGGDPALAVTKTTSGSGKGNQPRTEAIVGLPPDAGTYPFYTAWESQGNYLSYDTQVKIAAGTPDGSGVFSDKPDYYLAGLSFRYREDTPGKLRSYGLSFMRSRTGTGNSSDGIPDAMVPQGSLEDTPMVILWDRGGRGNVGGDEWMAYMELPPDDPVLDQPPSGNDRGAWTSGTGYVVDDVVTHNGLEYVCFVAHTATSGNNSNEPSVGNNWEDYWEVHEAIYLSDWATIVVRIVEAASILHEGEKTSITTGDTVTGTTSGAEGEVVKKIETDTGEILLLNNLTGTFQAFEQVTSGGTTITAAEWRERDNYIWAFYGEESDHGTANDTPLDFANRLGNERSGDIHWPVSSVSEWAADGDYFTLVQWNASLNTASYPDTVRLGKGKELNSIIRTNLYVTPYDVYDYPPELGVHAMGNDAINTYFDDLAIRLKGKGEDRVVGFLPPSIVEQE